MIPRISATEWNDHVRFLRTRYPVKVRVPPDVSIVHSWMVTPSYDYKRRRWTATVQAGSVNGKIATLETVLKTLPQKTLKYLRLTQIVKEMNDEKSAQVPLDFEPYADLPWREIGGDADPLTVSESGGGIRTDYEKVPAYFKKLNVPEAGAPPKNPDQARRLFACEVVLTQPRTAITNLVSSFPGGPLAGSVISVEQGFLTPKNSTAAPRVAFFPRFAYQPVVPSFADIFFQRFQDEPFDQILLATVYALSPVVSSPNFPSFVNDQFELMTRYYCHYNLAHATRYVPQAKTNNLTLNTGLAAGLGDVMFNYILANHNDFAQATLDLYNQNSLRGTFWVV